MQYILLLRSVNLGKLRKVSMPELKSGWLHWDTRTSQAI